MEFVGDDAARLPLADQVADAALVTWTLCALDDPATACRELYRVLRPGAFAAYLEHGADAEVLRRQQRLDRLYHAVGGCHLDRIAPDLFTRAGFVLEHPVAERLPGAPRITGLVYRGTARRPR